MLILPSLCCPEPLAPIGESDAKVKPLPMSRDTYLKLTSAWHLPTELLRMLFSTMAISTTFSVHNGPGAVQSKGNCSAISSVTYADYLLGIMIRSGRSRDWSFCIATLYDPTTDTTLCVIHGLDERETAVFKECLKNSLELSHNPMIIPMILTELKVHYFARLLERRDTGLSMIEFQTGMRHGFSEDIQRNGTKQERLAKRAELDFDLTTQQLTGLAGTFAFCNLSLDVGLRSLELVENISQVLHQRTNEQDDVFHPLNGRIGYLRALIIGAQSHRLLLQQRMTAQVQTVYSLVGQKDAAAQMTISVHTRQDSISMRIIAAVTLLFLPATALAVSKDMLQPSTISLTRTS